MVGSTKHAMDWPFHSITTPDYRDIVGGPDLARIEHMEAQAMASVLLSLIIHFLFETWLRSRERLILSGYASCQVLEDFIGQKVKRI